MSGSKGAERLGQVRGFAWFVTIGWVIVAGLALCAVVLRDNRDPDPIVATVSLPRNHQIANGDLETAVIRGMQGKFLVQGLGKGEAVTMAMLADEPAAPVTENTAAAIVKLARTDSALIGMGDRVLLCSGTTPLTGRVRVISISCDAEWCSAVIELPTVPDALQGVGALVAASLTKYVDCSQQ